VKRVPKTKIAKDADEPKPQTEKIKSEEGSESQIAKDKDEPKPPSKTIKCEEGFEKPVAKDKDEPNPQSKTIKAEEGSGNGRAIPKGAQRSVPSSPPPAPAKKEESKKVQIASDLQSPKAKAKNKKSKRKEKEERTEKGEDVGSTPPTLEPKRSNSKRTLFCAAVATVKAIGFIRKMAKKKPAKDEGETAESFE
jgi:hypothetical protein